MAPLAVIRHEDVSTFAERAGPWLLQAEAENNLLLSIIERLRANPNNDSSPYHATIERDGVVAGCAFRTPPHKFGVTEVPLAAIPLLVRDVADVYPDLPAVMGPDTAARAFALAWAGLRGVSARPGMHHRIYRLTKVEFPKQMAGGELRLAARRDLELIVAWLHAFEREAKVGAVNTAAFVEAHINHKTLFVWEDEGEPRTSAVYAGRTPNGVRVGFVYTPPEWRGRGYASACVATVSQRALDNGAAFCCLFADLGNPTSNDIYQRIGYRPVSDVMDYEFIARGSAS